MSWCYDECNNLNCAHFDKPQSTTFSIMVGRERPCGGAVFLEPLDITMLSLPHRARLGIGYMNQVQEQALRACFHLRAVLQGLL